MWKGVGRQPQGASVSPLLANIYLHYVFDLWAHQWQTPGTRTVTWLSCVSRTISWRALTHLDDAERSRAELREQTCAVSPWN